MHRFKKSVLTALLIFLTWPYYRTLRHYTLVPIRNILKCTDDGELLMLIERWRKLKKTELEFVKIAVSRNSPTTFRKYILMLE